MAKKKARKSTKTPEKSISDRVEFHKGQNKTLRKRIDNLEKRLFALEERMAKYKKLLPDDAPLNFGKAKAKAKTQEDFRQEFLKEFRPNPEENE